MKTIIHVNQHAVKRNAKNGTTDPVLTVKTYKSNNYAHTVKILVPSQVVYRPGKPLSCGARVWIETEAEVVTSTAQHSALSADEPSEEQWLAALGPCGK
jgi:hypothetical protein